MGVSYRLTPEPLKQVLQSQREKTMGLKDIKWIFGGTEPIAKVAEERDIFYVNGTEYLIRPLIF